MIKISPSIFKLTPRCGYAVAMSRFENPVTKERLFEPFFSPDTKENFFKGRYFEECLTGIPYSARSEHDGAEYASWKNSSRRSVTLGRIAQHAGLCKPYFKFSEPHQASRFLAWNFPEFEWRGILDYLGGMVGYGDQRFIVDVKYTGSIPRIWDVGGAMPNEDLYQVIQYSLAHALLKSADPDLFMQAARTQSPDERHALLVKFAKTTEILDGMYFVCESQETGNQLPLVRTILINITPQSLLDIYLWLRKQVTVLKEFMIYGPTYQKDLERIIQPDDYKCFGSNENKGRCSYLYQCPYGRKVIERPIVLNAENLFT